MFIVNTHPNSKYLKFAKNFEMDDVNVARHRILCSVISEISLDAGFNEIQTHALETLSELMKACKSKLCPSLDLTNNL